jgi:hypothetical protein
MMLFVLIFAITTLASATANNVSSKPRDNKVSTYLSGVSVKVKRKKKKKEKNENGTDNFIAAKHHCC